MNKKQHRVKQGKLGRDGFPLVRSSVFSQFLHLLYNGQGSRFWLGFRAFRFIARSGFMVWTLEFADHGLGVHVSRIKVQGSWFVV
jgi:hypothetical protein